MKNLFKGLEIKDNDGIATTTAKALTSRWLIQSAVVLPIIGVFAVVGKIKDNKIEVVEEIGEEEVSA